MVQNLFNSPAVSAACANFARNYGKRLQEVIDAKGEICN